MTLMRSLRRILLEGYPSSTCDTSRRHVGRCSGACSGHEALQAVHGDALRAVHAHGCRVTSQ